MAHIGSFVPAASASIGLCDRIFARLGAAREASGTSSLMADLATMAAMLRLSTSR